MRKAVVTLTIGDFYDKMAKITHANMKAYADKIGADFIVWDNHDGYQMPHYKKMDLGKLLEEYDRIIYIDTDILVRDDAPDLFELVPQDQIGAFNEGRFLPREQAMYQFMAQTGLNPEGWNKKYYNTGVLVVSKEHKHVFQKPAQEINSFYEQTYLNAVIYHLGIKVFDLPYRFNRMYALDHLTGEERHDSYFMHYAGVSLNLPKNEMLKLMRKDLKVWKKSAPEYKFQKNIAFIVEGGMGDQIAAEPAVRYGIEFVYKGENIIIISDWPELFTHLGVPVYYKTDKIKEFGKYHQRHTLNSPDHISWEFMSHPLVHCVDFASLQALRCTLPLEKKTPKLPLSPDAIRTLSDKLEGKEIDVLLHPGRGWPSKTFPADVWQSYADVLTMQGYKVGIIGKRISKEQGVVEIDTSKCIDLVDKLTISELIALIAHTKVLITNDSSPVHIAGAFDNWIGLIATCKHPEYILHYRKGSQTYMAQALERQPMYFDYEQQPSLIDGATIDKVTEERLRESLPTIEDILRFVDFATLHNGTAGLINTLMERFRYEQLAEND